ncbi:MAG: hypothetical protein EXR95_07030 [Gemmatimonadetes bacterium]|nr:hypothetical protein [Gemmatimonadota bacterium]
MKLTVVARAKAGAGAILAALVASTLTLSCGYDLIEPLPPLEVRILPDSARLVPGQRQAFTVTISRNGQPIPGVASWTSSAEGRVQVSNSGMVTASTVGVATIKAQVEGASDSAVVTVSEGGMATRAGGPLSAYGGALSLLVPAGAAGDVVVAVTASSEGAGPRVVPGTVFQLSPALTFGEPATLVLRYDPARLPTGARRDSLRIHQLIDGVWTLVAGGTSVPATNTAIGPIRSLGTFGILTERIVARVSVTPDSTTLQIGGRATLAATAFDAAGVAITGRSVTWSSEGTAVSVDAAGTVTAQAEGRGVVVATIDGVTGRAAVGVLRPAPAPVATVGVAIDDGAIQVGASTRARVTLRDANQNVLEGRVVTWESLAPTVASVDAAGQIIGLSAGSTSVRATSEGKTGTAGITVTAAPPSPPPVATVAVALEQATLQVGGTTQATATLRDAGNNVLTGRALAWESLSPAVASVNSTGQVRALATGSATIRATSEGRTGATQLEVIAPGPARAPAAIDVTAEDSTLTLGQRTSMTVVTRDAAGNVVPHGPMSWRPDPNQVMAVPVDGIAVGQLLGYANVVGEVDGLADTVRFEVRPASNVIDGDGMAFIGPRKQWYRNFPVTATTMTSDTVRSVVAQIGSQRLTLPMVAPFSKPWWERSWGPLTVDVPALPYGRIAASVSAYNSAGAEIARDTASFIHDLPAELVVVLPGALLAPTQRISLVCSDPDSPWCDMIATLHRTKTGETQTFRGRGVIDTTVTIAGEMDEAYRFTAEAWDEFEYKSPFIDEPRWMGPLHVHRWVSPPPSRPACRAS